MQKYFVRLPFRWLLNGVFCAFPSILISILFGYIIINPFICVGVVMSIMAFYLIFLYKKVLLKQLDC